MTQELKSYNELMELQSYDDRLRYLMTFDSNPGNKDRDYMNVFYKSDIWQKIREEVIRRDLGCDLGIYGLDINDRIIVHHINPITEEDVRNGSPLLFDLNNLISVSEKTHNAIHYRKKETDPLVERSPGDTILW